MTIFDRDFDNLLLPPATKEKVKKGEIKKPKKQSGTGTEDDEGFPTHPYGKNSISME